MRILIATALLGLCLSSDALAQIAVIANKSAPVDTIGRNELLDFYSGDVRKWSDDQPVVAFDLKPKEEVREVFYKYLGKSSSRMKSIWLRRVLSGEGQPPEALRTEEEVVKKVAETAGAIGFVSAAKLNDKVKVLLLVRTPD
jgi:ABC-type phosphate transport system substrate-binding protein